MIEALLRIIDRLIELRRGRIISRKELFDRVLEPTFDDLLAVHGDYIEMFEEISVFAGSRQSKSSMARRVAKAKAELRKRRIEFEPVRQKIRGFAGELKEKELRQEEMQFVTAVICYLPSGEPSLPHSAATTLLEYLERDLSPEAIDMLVSKTLQRHRNAWSDVCTAFAALKFAIASAR